MTPKYRTIVADPPWHYENMPSVKATGKSQKVLQGTRIAKPMPYPTMTVDEIKELPVRKLSDTYSRLFLWTTNHYLPAALDILVCWGFRYTQTLVWHKLTGPPFGGSIAKNRAEFLLVGNKGTPRRVSVAPSSVIIAPRSTNHHSRKPDAFLDLVESVSPGPYLELFARRQRLGWDTWGDEALEHVEMVS